MQSVSKLYYVPQICVFVLNSVFKLHAPEERISLIKRSTMIKRKDQHSNQFGEKSFQSKWNKNIVVLTYLRKQKWHF